MSPEPVPAAESVAYYWERAAVPCHAKVKIHDDRYGSFWDHCQLGEGHPGDHRIKYSACEPVAYLCWSNNER